MGMGGLQVRSDLALVHIVSCKGPSHAAASICKLMSCADIYIYVYIFEYALPCLHRALYF